MERYQIILSYDGTDFHGFQRQGSTRTVQLEVENALRRMGWQGKSILAAGRTDTGVHADGQVIAFDFEWAHPQEKIGRALNAFLPRDVGVCEVRKASSDFHPRFDAIWRTYTYHIYFQPFRNPLQDRFAWRIWPKFDFEPLERTAEMFVGTYDFSSFGKAMRQGGNTERTIIRSEWSENDGQMHYQITANAFLYHMVRRIVHAQIQVALGKLTAKQLYLGLKEGAQMPSGMAPPNGLVLQEVSFLDESG